MSSLFDWFKGALIGSGNKDTDHKPVKKSNLSKSILHLMRQSKDSTKGYYTKPDAQPAPNDSKNKPKP